MTSRYDPHACPFARARQAQILARKRFLARERRQERARQGLSRTSGIAPAGVIAPARSAMQTIGSRYEDLALDHLLQAGLRLIARNPRCRMGEIDLVMRDGTVMVFVEVRARSRGDFGGAAASVTATKRARLIRAASLLWPGLVRSMMNDLRLASAASRPASRGRPAIAPSARFDVVTFQDGAIHWLTHAFTLD